MTDPTISRQHIRQAMRESVGWGRAHSLKEAAALTGLGTGTLYQIADGTNKFPERHILALLDIPEFADRFMSLRGHACAFIGNEAGCPRDAIAAVMEATGESAFIVADGKITDPEKHKLSERLRIVVRKAQAFLHRFSRERMERAIP